MSEKLWSFFVALHKHIHWKVWFGNGTRVKYHPDRSYPISLVDSEMEILLEIDTERQRQQPHTKLGALITESVCFPPNVEGCELIREVSH